MDIVSMYICVITSTQSIEALNFCFAPPRLSSQLFLITGMGTTSAKFSLSLSVTKVNVVSTTRNASTSLSAALEKNIGSRWSRRDFLRVDNDPTIKLSDFWLAKEYFPEATLHPPTTLNEIQMPSTIRVTSQSAVTILTELRDVDWYGFYNIFDATRMLISRLLSLCYCFARTIVHGGSWLSNFSCLSARRWPFALDFVYDFHKCLRTPAKKLLSRWENATVPINFHLWVMHVRSGQSDKAINWIASKISLWVILRFSAPIIDTQRDVLSRSIYRSVGML